MKGYTIEKSIDLLEKDVQALKHGGGGGGASSWNELQNKPFNTLGEEFYNLDGALTLDTVSADKVALPESSHYDWDYLPQAIEALAEDSNHFSDDIAELETSLANTRSYSLQEKVIGTWVNGTLLYERTWFITSLRGQTVLYDQWKEVTDIDATDFAAVIDGEMVWLDTGYGTTSWNAVNYTVNVSNNITAFHNHVAIILYRGGVAMNDCYITLRYIKKSDQ